ncbi:DinB family protein [Paenibacillus sp. VMFN-D1]|uniref:DinB family protein n=1 Tax=Paenibacillus sp. VMFN-D1 TaxID=2135608 RepID=UPI000E2810D7|nr:DinB family protein [Paenibacillus sp. VMFN-D1]RED36465.1 putative damage-inducible protein DinB [Paenibacillus sp. VMFN-D1]
MSQIQVLLQRWDECFGQEDWYPPLVPALEGVTAEEAAWKPEGEAVNSIWENVNHLLYYKEYHLQRMRGENPDFKASSNDETFSNVEDGDEAWQKTVDRLKQVHGEIRSFLSGLSDSELNAPFPTRPLASLIHSLMMHDAYHTGQIIMLRKQKGSWPASRNSE